MKKRHLTYIVIGALLGSAAGYAYYYFVGCASGTCAITSNPINSAAYGALMGGLLFSSIYEGRTNKEAE
jgi:uncharacterized membrane protein